MRLFKRKFEKEMFSNYLIDFINQTNNYIQLKVEETKLSLTYWVKDPFSYTKTQIFFYSDYHFTLNKKDIPLFTKYIYNHLNLKERHEVLDNEINPI